MSNQIWRGDAVGVAQVNTITPANVLVGNTFTVTINGKSVTYTAAAATVADVVAGLQALLAAATIAEFVEVTWTVNGTTNIVATAATAGVPFTQTSSASGGTATLTTATATASAGPNDWSTAANWSTGSVPVNSDTVWIQNSASSILYGLSQSAVTLTAINADSTFTGYIGLPRTNASGYIEYRPTYLAISATTVNLGGGGGSGSGRTKLDLGSVQALANVFSAGSPTDQGLPAVILKGTHASNVLNAQQGQIGSAIEAGDTSTWLTTQVGYQQSQGTDVVLTFGVGCTLTTISQYGGTLNVNSSVTTVNQYGGTLNVYAAATITTLDSEEGGAVNWLSSGTLGTGTVGVGCTLDYSKDPRAKTATTLTVAGELNDPNKVVTYTNPVKFPNGVGGSSGATLNWGSNFSLQRS